MEEIKTKIDEIFDFIQRRGSTTPNEVSKEFRMGPDELDKYVHVLSKSGLIKVHYSWLTTHFSVEESDSVPLAGEFKSTMNNEYAGDSAVLSTKDAEIADKNLKIITMKRILKK